METPLHNSSQVILNKRLIKAIVRNDVKDFQRLIHLGADVNSEFTIDELINNKLIDSDTITSFKNAETTVDELAKNRFMDKKILAAIKEKNYSKVICLPTFMNKIILSNESKLSPLQLAILHGWKAVIIELIKKGANPNKALCIQGITILQLMCTAAVFKDKEYYIFDEEIVQLLFDHGADPNIQDLTGKTFLHYAILNADFHVEEAIGRLKIQSNTNSDSDAFKHKDTRRIEKFLINGTNPNIKTNNCCTILFDIIEHDQYLNEQPNLTNLFLDHGSIYCDNYEDVLKHPEYVAFMQEDYGRDFGLANAKDQVDRFNSEHKQQIEKVSLLIEAVKNKKMCIVSTLLNNGASPNIRDKDGLSALHIAVKLCDYNIAELLLNKGANPNIKSWQNGTTPLFNAVTTDRINIAELLLKHAANPSIINAKGLSPLYFSITNNNKKMTKLLLKYKANPNISHQISVLFNILNGIKNDSNIKEIENTLQKIRDIVKFLKSKGIPVDYTLFYQSVDISEKNDKKTIAKKVMELLDELIPHVSS